MRKTVALFILFSLFLVAFRVINDIDFTVPENWPKPVYDFSKNPLTSEKIALGRALFYDPLLSRNNSISCASCHSQYTAFTHVDHALSHGIDDRIGTRNSPALMNLAWQSSFMWDGAINHLDMQALAPISHPDEMDESIENLVKKLQQSTIYPVLFGKAYPDAKITGERVLKSIAQFLLTLISANSKYDSVMRKQATFTSQENNGYNLFKQYCASCHQEPLFSNGRFENNGLPMDSSLQDYGRMKVTGNPADSLKFKVPTLRNIRFSNPYMHDGRFNRLQDVLKYYTSGTDHGKNVSKPLKKPLLLSSDERVDIIAFLYTLTDQDFLFNPKYGFPRDIFFPPAKEN